MPFRALPVVFLGLALTWGKSAAAESHRIVVVSATDHRTSGPCIVRLIDVESAKPLAQIDVGGTAEIAISPSGDMLAVLSQYSIGGIAQPKPRLEIFRTT